jgi:hypothetical protein
VKNDPGTFRIGLFSIAAFVVLYFLPLVALVLDEQVLRTHWFYHRAPGWVKDHMRAYVKVNRPLVKAAFDSARP